MGGAWLKSKDVVFQETAPSDCDNTVMFGNLLGRSQLFRGSTGGSQRMVNVIPSKGTKGTFEILVRGSPSSDLTETG